MKMRTNFATAIVLLACFHVNSSNQTLAQAGGQSPVTENDLRKLVAEKERIVIVQDTSDVYWVLKASNASTINKTTIEVPRLVDVMIIENKVVVVGGTERPLTKKDLLETARNNWTEPLESKKTYWNLTGHNPAELIQIAKGQYAESKKIDVKTIVTWWCPTPGPNCHEPKN